jgi:tetratricopeptide (TPR) repeat protein
LLKEIKSYNYYTLELKSQGNEERSNIVDLLSKRKDTASVKILSRTYANIGNTYFDNNKLDSAYFYYKLSLNLAKTLPEKYVSRGLFSKYLALGNFYLKKKNNDSTLYYFQKSDEILKKYNHTSLEFQSLWVYGNYYKQQKDYQKALDYYLQSIKKMEENSVVMGPQRDIYKSIAECYRNLNQKDLQKKYENLFTEKENQTLLEKSKNIDYALNSILNDQQKEYAESQKRKYTWISIAVVILLLIFFYFYKLLRKNLHSKENTITEVTNNLQEKEKIISEKHIETEELQSKVNDGYNEIIELAKNNDSSFYPRFQQVYPDFQKKLLEISPTLRTSELILCAYTFLGFTIKDVADYTFKSVNTIRNRKQNLRKKIQHPN